MVVPKCVNVLSKRYITGLHYKKVSYSPSLICSHSAESPLRHPHHKNYFVQVHLPNLTMGTIQTRETNVSLSLATSLKKEYGLEIEPDQLRYRSPFKLTSFRFSGFLDRILFKMKLSLHERINSTFVVSLYCCLFC